MPLLERIESTLDQMPPNPAGLDSLLTTLDVRMDKLVAELTALEFFEGS